MKYFCILLWMLLGGTSTNASFCNRDCGGVITDSRGVVLSPGFGDVYRNNLRCCWLIQAENSSNTIVAEIQQLDVEPNSRCAFDYLQIYDGSSTPLNADALSGPICGDTLPPQTTFVSSADKLMVFFYTDTSTQFGGFQIAFQEATPSGEIVQAPPESCVSTLDESGPGWFTSPNYPENYDDDVSCTWYIQAPENHTIELTFNDFELEFDDDCRAHDYVEVFEQNLQSSRGFFCGTPAGEPSLVSFGATMIVSFTSNNDTNSRGFNASYVFLAPPEPCGGILDESGPGWFTSPNYPDNYEDNRFCSWTIQAPENHTIQLTFTDFYTEYDIFCSKDYVQVFDEDFSNVANLCGVPSVLDFTSEGSTMTVQFVSNFYLTYGGFNASYTFIAPSPAEGRCGSPLTDNTGVIDLADNFNNPEGPFCWQISGGDGENVQLIISTIEIPNTNLSQDDRVAQQYCMENHLQIFDGAEMTDANLMATKQCNDFLTSPNHFITTSKDMIVLFTTNETHPSETGASFQASYELVAAGTPGPANRIVFDTNICGNMLDSTQGTISSPNFGVGKYQSNLRCVWYIDGPPDSTIQVLVNEMAVESHNVCRYDYLQFFDGDRLYENPVSAKLCGTTAPQGQFTAISGTMLVYFETDSSSEYNGWTLDFDVITGRR